MARSSLASTRSIISFQVRMQSRSKTVPHGTGVISNFKSMYHDEGVTGLWRGVVPTAQRAAVVAGVQLPVYDRTKLFLLQNGILEDSAANHLVSSFFAGLCACLASSPVGEFWLTRFQCGMASQ